MPLHSNLAQYAEIAAGDQQFQLQNSRLLRVPLAHGPVQAAAGSMVAYQGNLRFTREKALDQGLGNLLKKAYITVLLNGVVTHHRQAYLGATGHKSVANYNKIQETGPLKLQDHGNPTRYRNIWVRELDLDAHE